MMKILTKKKRIKIIWGFFCALLVLCEVLNVGSLGVVHAEEAISLYATAAVLMDADTGRVLYEKKGDEPLAMASTTKVMTCILLLEKGNLDDVLTVSGYAASMPKVKLYIKKGEQYTVRDLLYSLMLESHNDSAVALAEYLGKQYLPEELRNKDTGAYTVEESKRAVAAFAGLMNEKAKLLGCEDTWFITPNGLDATETFMLEDGSSIQKEHHTTAAELARIFSYCIKESSCKETFLEITRTPGYAFSANGRNFSCSNHNSFLNMMSGALSGKTGFTNKAGYCYVGALENEGRTFVVALLACGWPNNKSYKWSDTKELMKYGMDNYFYKSFSDAGVAFDESRLQKIPVLGGRNSILGETAYTDIRIVDAGGASNAGMDIAIGDNDEEWVEGLLLKQGEEIEVEYSQKKVLTAPTRVGEVVGAVEYKVDGKVYKRQLVVTKDEIKRIDLEWCFRQILERFLLVR